MTYKLKLFFNSIFISLFVFFLSLVHVSAVSSIHTFNYTGDYQEFVAPGDGYYQIEAWGAGGGKTMRDGSLTSSYVPGKGAYTSGVTFLHKGVKLYIYVGGKGSDAKKSAIVPGGYNGGGQGDHDHKDDDASGAGGGATDIRLVGGAWDDFDSLKSRVMVAAGGGGATYNLNGGYGGALTGGNVTYSQGGTQVSGYAFGKGMDGVYVTDNTDIAGGGGGYYGGYANTCPANTWVAAGAGGSSFISGHAGCDAIALESTESNIVHTGMPNHYSKMIFKETSMIAGNASMPSFDGASTMTGNPNNGYVKIKRISDGDAIANIRLENQLVYRDDDYNHYEYTAYLKQGYPTTATFDLELYGNPASVVGYQNVPLVPGSSFDIALTTQTGDVLIYTVKMEIQKAHINSLSFDYLKLKFKPFKYEYSGTVPYKITDLKEIITKDPNVTYEIEGNAKLKVGENIITIRVYEDGYAMGEYKIKVTREEYKTTYLNVTKEFKHTGSGYQTFKVPRTGYYEIEAWGASGGRHLVSGVAGSYLGGKGAYTKGKIFLEYGETLYIYVGGKGSDGKLSTVVPGGYNGGGTGDYDHADDEAAGAGGGATDIRLVSGLWDNFNSLRSRIMVAAGGGGSADGYTGGYGGSIQGQDTLYSKGGTQVSGYAFGKGMDGVYKNSNVDVAGGGGGYYGGYANSSGKASTYKAAGAGGSSFVSGCTDCDAISIKTTKNNIIHTGQGVHYSGKEFTDIVMAAGNEKMPSITNKNATMTGNDSDGYAKITLVETLPIMIDLDVENAKIMEPVSVDEHIYHVVIPHDDFTTNITVGADMKDVTIIGDKNVTLKVGEPHYIVLMHSCGEVSVYQLIPTLEKPTLTNISFEEVSFDFSPSVTSYRLSVPNRIRKLTPDITKDDKLTYVVNGSLDLRVGDNAFSIIVRDEHGTENTYEFHVYREYAKASKEFDLIANTEEFIVPQTGWYKIEAWGAAGGRNMDSGSNTTSYTYPGGKGAYTKGEIYLEAGTVLYINVGGRGSDAKKATVVPGGYNGGGQGDWDHNDDESSAAGGGATDIRLVDGAWDDFDSLKSRIMVAGGGGGSSYYLAGGYGGALKGQDTKYSKGGTQISGYAFGKGMDGVYKDSNVDVAGGGGGYYGGYANSSGKSSTYYAAGAGGSSFVSGCTGCDAIAESSTESHVVHTGQSNHYSGHVFKNIVMKAGNEVMPSYTDATKTMTGNSESGRVKIEFIDTKDTKLTSLTTSVGEMTPAFDPDVYEYRVVLDNIDTEVEINATTNNTEALITGTGTLKILAGQPERNIVLTDETGNTKIYKLTFEREENNYKFLEGILVNGIPIKDFSRNKFVYDVEVPYYLEKINLKAIKHNDGQKVKEEGTYDFDVDVLTKVLFVISEDGSENQTYTVNIHRKKTSLLKELKTSLPNVNLDFKENQTDYDLVINKNILELDFTAIPYYKSAKITIEGNTFIEEGDIITVTSHVEGVEDTVYHIKIIHTDDASYEGSYDCTGKMETFVAPYSGYYHIKLWGAAGGQGMTDGVKRYIGGEGSYTSGTILLRQGEIIYFNVGCKGQDAGVIDKFTGGLGGYNGGANGGNDSNRDSSPEPGSGGGGATDIRLIDGAWNNDASLRSRIMVSAGASGGSYYYVGIPGGGLEGYKPSNSSLIATQTSGYAFGYGKPGNSATAGSSGAGGGYYGGYNLNIGSTSYISGGSGSSYISGHAGSIGTTVEGSPVASTYTTIEDSYNYSGKYFTDTRMIDGAGYAWTTKKSSLELMPNPNGGYFASGHGNNGDGHASIQLLTVLSSNNFLDNIILNDGDISLDFHPGTLEYDVYLMEDETTLKVDAIAKDDRAIITGTGLRKIPPRDSVIPIAVTSTDGSVRVYNLNVYREPSSDSTPENIKVNKMTPYICSLGDEYCKYTFDPDTTDYDILVPFAINKVEIVPVPKSDYQTIIYRAWDGTDFVEVENGNINLLSGSNKFQVEIISEDEVNSTVYNYDITRDPRGNTNVTDIKVVNPVIDIPFAPLTYEYTINLESQYSQVEFEVTPELADATVTIRGNKNLGLGMNDAYIVVNAPNGETKTYIFHIYKKQDTNVFLSSLEVKNGETSYSLNPTFDKTVNDYTVEIPSSVSDVDITALAESSSAHVEVVKPSKLISGINQIKINVTNGEKDINTYNVNIIKQKDGNPNLANIEVKGYTLEEDFNKDITEYHVTVPKGVNKLELKVTPEVDTTTYTIRGNNNLINNTNRIVITSIAQNKTKKVYYLYVTKDVSNNNDLTDIELSEGVLSPMFDKDTTSYEVNVASTVDKINVKGILADSNAYITGNGEYALVTGENTISLKVTSELGEEKTYTVKVIRGQSDDNSLKEVKNDQNSVVTKASDTKYVLDVQYDVKKITIEGIPNDPKSTVLGNGTYDLNTGENPISLTVTSESGNVATYEVVVVRDLSHNDDLAYLFAKEGALNPVFKDTTIFYDVYVDNSVTQLTLDVITEDENATYEVTGNENFVVGENKVVVTVTAPSGDKKAYTLNVIRQDPTTDELLLSDLEISDGELAPEFSSYDYIYHVTVPNYVSSMTVTGTAVHDNHRVLGNGTYSLRVGKNAIGVGVVNDDGIRKDYQVVITREKSPDATLASLVVKGHSLSPRFNKSITNYTINTSASSLEFTTIKPTEADATYVVEGNKNFVTGVNTVTITVTAPNGKDTEEYVLTVNKSPSKNNNLASLEVVGKELIPPFHKGTTFYTLDVANDVNSVVVNATPEDKASTVTGIGLHPIASGANEILIEVTSEAGTKKVYTVLVTKDGSDNNYLDSLLVSEGILSPEFNKEVDHYEVTVPYEIDSISIAGTTEVRGSTVTGVGDHTLKVGSNMIKVEVTSEAGTVREYYVNVIRENLISAKLESLEVTGYELDQSFDPDFNEYYINVPNEVFEVDLTAIAIDKTATVEITGNEDFHIGMNEVVITVTSGDGTLTETYTLYVNRQLSTNNKLLYLTVDQGTLSPVFSPDTMVYNVEVANDITEITVDAEASDSTAKIISGLGKHKLVIGQNKIFVKVRSMTGVERTYTIHVNRQSSDDNSLLKLQVFNGTELLAMTPSFDKDTLKYTLSVPASVKFVTISAEAANAAASITGDGTKELTLDVNTFPVEVMSEGGTSKTYEIEITRVKSTNNKVLNITPSVGTLAPEFNADTHEYSMTVSDTDLFLGFDVVTEDSSAIISGHEQTIVPNDNFTRTITVTAENGDVNTYTINVTRETLSDARLDSLTIAGYPFEFDPDTFTYNIQVSRSKSKLLESEITAIAKDSEATINFIGDLDLSLDIINIYTIDVIAKDGYTSQEYKLNITRDSTVYTLINPTYTIDRDKNYIVGMEPNYKLEDFITTFENDPEMIRFYDKQDTVITDLTSLTSSYMKVRLEKDGIVYDELEIIVLGDVNGDGKINVGDKAMINNHILKIKLLADYEFIAANMNHDGVINVGDKTIVNNYILKIISSVN